MGVAVLPALRQSDEELLGTGRFLTGFVVALEFELGKDSPRKSLVFRFLQRLL